MNQSLFYKWGMSMAGKRMAKPRFWIYMIVALTILFVSVYYSQGGYLTRQAEHMSMLDAERAALYLQNEELERKVEFAKSSEYIERVAREDLGWVMPGQIRFVAQGQ